MTSDFLPDNYEIPSSSNGYMKFRLGENRFRVLSSAITGSETWVTDKDGNRKPLRYREGVTIPVEEVGDDPKHFWAFVVWNYNDNRIQILEITQKGIMKAMRALTKNPKWGSPMDYDIVITREGEGLETEYTVQPDPKEELDANIKKLYSQTQINLEALYDGADPFAISEIDESDPFSDVPDNL